MSGRILWLTRDDCLALHDLMLSQYGGLAGVRDRNLLDSAIARPQQLLAYENPGIPAMAAAYAAGIVRNHPFVDGNKRTGFMMAAGFLELNGFDFLATEVEVVMQTLALAAGESSESDYRAWLESNCRER